MSSSFEDDRLVVPVKGTIKIECKSGTADFFLYLIYKSISLNEWKMIKKNVRIIRETKVFKNFKQIFFHFKKDNQAKYSKTQFQFFSKNNYY